MQVGNFTLKKKKKSIWKTGFWLYSCLTAFLWLTGITDNDSFHCVKHWMPTMIVVFPSVLDNSVSQHVHLVVLTSEQISVHFPGCLQSSPSELRHIMNHQSWNINNIQFCYHNLFSHNSKSWHMMLLIFNLFFVGYVLWNATTYWYSLFNKKKQKKGICNTTKLPTCLDLKIYIWIFYPMSSSFGELTLSSWGYCVGTVQSRN